MKSIVIQVQLFFKFGAEKQRRICTKIREECNAVYGESALVVAAVGKI